MTVIFLGVPCPEELCFTASFLSHNDSRSLDSRLDLKQYHLPGINHEAHTDKWLIPARRKDDALHIKRMNSYSGVY